MENKLRYGLIAPVVLGIHGITVGRGYAGTSGESSYTKVAFFTVPPIMAKLFLPMATSLHVQEKRNLTY